MKKVTARVILMLAILTFLAGCGSKVERDITGSWDNDRSIASGSSTDKGSEDKKAGSDSKNDNGLYSFMAQVIENSSSLLVSPAPDSNEIKSSDRIIVSVADDAIKGLDGSMIKRQELKPGDLVRISYDGGIRESYPAQLSASLVELTGRNIVIDAYIALIDDIYNEDPGLNEGITIMALNTLGWNDVRDIDKEIIFSLLKESYGLEIIEGTFVELAEQGLIDKDELYFEKGILIAISNFKYNEKDKSISCSIEKWRGGLGAIGSEKVTAEYRDGKWIITKSDLYIAGC